MSEWVGGELLVCWPSGKYLCTHHVVAGLKIVVFICLGQKVALQDLILKTNWASGVFWLIIVYKLVVLVRNRRSFGRISLTVAHILCVLWGFLAILQSFSFLL